MYTKNYRQKCDGCGKFAKSFDSYTPFGCRNPEDPEPYDATDLCYKCSIKHEDYLVKCFKKGMRYGDWTKSTAERNAAFRCGLVWIGNTTMDLGTRQIFNTYVTLEEFRSLVKHYNF